MSHTESVHPRRLSGVVASLWLSLALACAANVATAAESKALTPLAMIGFELIEENPDPPREADQARRLVMIEQQFAQAIVAKGLYTPVDMQPAQALIESLRKQQEFLYRCESCQLEIGKTLKTRLVASGWVQKVSNLILNVNLQVRDVDMNRIVLTRSVDMRGNDDTSWTRALDYLLRAVAERRDSDPGYGL